MQIVQHALHTRLFLTFAVMLMAVGVLLVDSSSMSSRNIDADPVQLSKHLTFLLLAALSGGLAAGMPKSAWRYIAPVMYLVTVGLLIAVLIPGLGYRVNGAQRWIRIGVLTLQPSETAKLSLPLAVCGYRFRSSQPDLSNPAFSEGLIILGMVGLPVLLILAEPDLGTALFVSLCCAGAMFLTRWPIRQFVIAAALLMPVLGGLLALRPYQVSRLQGFLQTWQSPELSPYQVKQSLTTLGVGGIYGTGLGRGWQKLSFLPEADTDFVFSVIGEELGLIGTLGVVGLWLGLYLSGLRLIDLGATTERTVEIESYTEVCPRLRPNDSAGQRANPSFEWVLAVTLLTQLVLQAAINVAVVTAMLPPKGISHPFISYGGSNLVVSVCALGIILSLTRMCVANLDETSRGDREGFD